MYSEHCKRRAKNVKRLRHRQNLSGRTDDDEEEAKRKHECEIEYEGIEDGEVHSTYLDMVDRHRWVLTIHSLLVSRKIAITPMIKTDFVIFVSNDRCDCCFV